MPQARLCDLKPIWQNIPANWTPETGGTPSDRFQLSFVCPSCRNGTRVTVYVGPTIQESPRTWKASPYPPNGANWPDQLSLEPSVGNEGVDSLGRRCNFHGTITSGVVTFP